MTYMAQAVCVSMQVSAAIFLWYGYAQQNDV